MVGISDRTIGMKTFVITARRAAFGWPFYVTRNLAAYTQEQAD